MDGERWCTPTKQLQETLLQVCEAVRRTPGELRNSGAAILQFVWKVEHYTQHTAHYTVHIQVRTLAWASMLVYVMNYSTNMPTREETCYGV